MSSILEAANPVDWLTDYFNVPRETMAPLAFYAEQLVKWQKAKNLVANDSLVVRWERHFLDSVQLYPIIKADWHEKAADGGIARKPRLLDLGSGAGFPGLVLAFTGLVDAHMVEANGRKCSFMKQLVQQARMNGFSVDSSVHQARIESLDAEPFDYISSRACASLNQLLTWSYRFSSQKTQLLFLKGETYKQEIDEAEKYWKMEIQPYPSLTNSKAVILQIQQLSPL